MTVTCWTSAPSRPRTSRSFGTALPPGLPFSLLSEMPLPFLADTRNWWILAGHLRRDLQPLLPFHDLYLIPAATAAAGEALPPEGEATPSFWCGPPEFNESSATLRLPLGENHTPWLEVILEGVSWGPEQ